MADMGSMWLELRAIVEEISASDARVIVLSSTSDKYFTAGLDCTFPLLQDKTRESKADL